MGCSFFGFRAKQIDKTIYALNKFFNELLLQDVRFNQIIELGTVPGGLSLLLGLYGFNHACPVYTFDVEDIQDRKLILLLQFLGVNINRGDVLDDSATINYINSLISKEGRTLLICDNGNKIREFEMYSDFLKAGDFIMGHDYCKDRETFDKEFYPTIWEWCELTYRDIQSSCERNNLIPFMQKLLAPVLWVCMRKGD